MRHRRMRRRYLMALAVLLMMTIVIFLEDRLQAMMPRLTLFTESKLEEILKTKEDISIGSIRGGILRDLELGDIEIRGKAASSHRPLFKIDMVKINYRIWDVLFRARAPRKFNPLVFSSPHIDIRIDSANGWLSGIMRLEGDLENAKAKGALNVFATQFKFNGDVAFSGDKIILKNLKVRNAVISQGEIDFKDQTFNIKAALDHAVLKGADIVGDISFGGRFRTSGDGQSGISLEADLEGENLIINHRPFDDVKLSFEIAERNLDISRFNMGRSLKVSGKVNLKGPAYPIDLVIVADNLNITQTLLNLRVQDIESISGVLNAKLQLKGKAANPTTKGRLEIRKGNLGDIYFRSMSALLSGAGTVMRIEDSRINMENGSFALVGDFDLKDIGKKNIFADVKVVTDDRNVVIGDWDIFKDDSDSKVVAGKDVSDTINVGFKTHLNDERTDPRDRKSELELGYKMYESDVLKLQMADDGEFVGLEHKEKF